MKLVIITTIFGTIISSTHSSILHLSEIRKDTVVGGYNASIEDFPYQVGIYITRWWMNENETLLCGGSIISERYILSAAHCLFMRLDIYTIRAGSEILFKGTTIPIAEAIIHPHFMKADVGVMRTKNPIEFSNVIKPIKLPPKGRYMNDESMFTMSGWGEIWHNETIIVKDDGLLKAINLTVFNFKKCQKILQDIITISKDANWCGGGTEMGGKGVCKGDSGGPAVQDNMVVGIVSRAKICAYPNTPDVYVNVAAPIIRDFIKEHTGL